MGWLILCYIYVCVVADNAILYSFCVGWQAGLCSLSVSLSLVIWKILLRFLVMYEPKREFQSQCETGRHHCFRYIREQHIVLSGYNNSNKLKIIPPLNSGVIFSNLRMPFSWIFFSMHSPQHIVLVSRLCISDHVTLFCLPATSIYSSPWSEINVYKQSNKRNGL